ncbi:MAG: Asp23/Gls24 family envelope stress response protein [Clostridia bacterium]|nr:Asp23/Gls24 family envelope stress response protein [Clostridia bacterium]MDO5303026.1 Asp23/Gls24 family envelope stress response protein [Clostridia bacterium]
MKVYTLTGKSGTGKSFQALNLCEKENIESIIDDGLYIYHNRVEAGISAKRQKTMVGAIKTALFTLDEHAQSVSDAIKRTKPTSILILGTSDKMTDKIVARLGLPPVDERIYIEDITTEEERETAGKQRREFGKHVIPAPTLQLKRTFAGYFMDPLSIIKGINLPFVKSGDNEQEKTVVRPTFSYLGEFIISDHVIADIARCLGKSTNGIGRILKLSENTHPDSLVVNVSITILYGHLIWETAMEFQSKLAEVIESMTAFNVEKINVEVKGMDDE